MQASNLLNLPKDIIVNEIIRWMYTNDSDYQGIINLSFTCKELHNTLQKDRDESQFELYYIFQEKMKENEWNRQCNQWEEEYDNEKLFDHFKKMTTLYE